MGKTAEAIRLEEDSQRKKNWKRWGPYLSERAWGTVREDYSPSGAAWDFFPHDHARSRVYRWNEDGLAGLCDRRQYICFALALWNGRDPILKERLFGLTGPEGNHGEDVKEYYFYLDSTPTHSYMKYLYKYPQAAFPYAQLVEENRRRGRDTSEFELIDTGVFAEDRYFDVFVEYAKATPEEILIRIQVINRGPDPALLHLLPTIWFRNTWSWGLDIRRPYLYWSDDAIELQHSYYGKRWLCGEGSPTPLFTNNETNYRRLFGSENDSPYVKDGFNDYLVHGVREAVNPRRTGTKAALHYLLHIDPHASMYIRLRLTDTSQSARTFGPDFDRLLAQRQQEADEYYAALAPEGLSADARNVTRQAFAGMLWSKQFYHYEVDRWLKGDPAMPPPPVERLYGRN
ncbi:MAG: glucosidase, partial [Candidatus Binatia bacterium]|nr:glucosidase [Candidatus Binatia bacterium]